MDASAIPHDGLILIHLTCVIRSYADKSISIKRKVGKLGLENIAACAQAHPRGGIGRGDEERVASDVVRHCESV